MIKELTQRNLHQRLQEYCDCYLESDLEFELEHLVRRDFDAFAGDDTETALKYLALALLTAIEERASTLIIAKWASHLLGGNCCLIPTPADSVVEKAIEIIKKITGVGRAKPYGTLALGLRADCLDLGVEDRVIRTEEEMFFTLPSRS
ncbi:MAG: hypothetical protein AB1696_28690 [Planctomycetota bacterium]